MSISSAAPWVAFYGTTPTSIDYPKMTMYQLLSETCRRYPANIAYSFQGKQTTYADFLKRIDAAAKGLYHMGIRKGDRVTVSVDGPSEVELFDVLCTYFNDAM